MNEKVEGERRKRNPVQRLLLVLSAFRLSPYKRWAGVNFTLTPMPDGAKFSVFAIARSLTA
jgi:hypothetical protein